LVDAEWTRVNYYKHRIRVFGPTAFHVEISTIWHDVSAQTLRELSLYHSNSPLLPNLRILNLRTLAPDSIPFARLFFGPCVRELQFPTILEEAESSIELLSSLIPHLSPNISDLSIVSIMRLPKPCTAVFQLIQGLRHSLRSLTIDVKIRGLHERVTAQLGGLSALRRLKMSLIPNSQLHFYATALGQFPALSEFSFEVETWTSATTVMGSMLVRFTYLSVTIDREGTLSDLQTFIESISRHPSVSSLTRLRLTDFDTSLDNADNETCFENIFRPLFAFTSLKHITIQVEVTAKLRDIWYNEAAAAWPRLEYISISSPNQGTIKAEMTLAGLIPLAKHCPKLKYIRLRLDAQPFDVTQIDRDEFSNTHIDNLCLQTYIIPSPREVYLSLNAIFPNLLYVFQASRYKSLSWPWDNVNHLLHTSAVHRRGPCITKQLGCTCGKTDGFVRTRPHTPDSSQLLATIGSLRSHSS
jgi:hypothetical protein